MPLLDYSNPDVIKFVTENQERQSKLRIRWNTLNKEKILKAAVLHREDKGITADGVKEHVMIGGLATITRDNTVSQRNRRKKPIRDAIHVAAIADLVKEHSIPAVGLGDPEVDPRLARPDDDLSLDPKMRPVDKNMESILYKAKPTFGRAVYLKHRERIKPENKYYFCECSGWQYGWRLDDSFFGHNSPQYGRVWKLTRSLKSRTGPQPDPDHYMSSDIPEGSKCTS